MRFEEISQSLMQRARDGQIDAMEDFCLLIQPGAYAVLLSLLRNTDDASDALQDSMIRLSVSCPTFVIWLLCQAG